MTLFSTTAGSLLFGAVFMRWKSIPAAVGIHAAWNFSRDLYLGERPDGAAIWYPVGLDQWSPAHWNTAQAIMVAVTLSAWGIVAAGRGSASLRRP